MNRSQARWLLVVAGVLLWLVAILPAYYVVHKPLAAGHASPPPGITFSAQALALGLLDLAANLLLLSITAIVAAAWGSRLAGRLGITFDSGLERWSLGAILGLGLQGSLVLLLGALGLLYGWVAYLLLGLLGLGALGELRELARWLRARLQRRPAGVPWLGLYAGAIGLLALTAALLPPTGWDALVYHLTGPLRYVQAHRLLAIPENFYLNWPAQGEMLFVWGLLLKGDVLAKLFHWIFWPLTAGLLYVLARRIMGEGGKWAVALWAAVPVAAELAGVAYVDLTLTATVLAGGYALLRWTESGEDGWLVLSSLFAGLAMATKYTAVTWLAAFVLLFAYHAWRHQGRSLAWIVLRGGGMGLVAGLVVLPWLIKSWLVAGNPVYPFLFGGVDWNATREAWLNWPGHGYSRNLFDYLALPWLMTVLGTSSTAAFDATIGPLLLCLVPLVLVARGWPRAIRYALALVGVQVVYFVVMIYRYVYLAETRLLLPAFPLLCLVGAYGLHRLADWDRKALRLSWLVGNVVVLVLVVNLGGSAYTLLSSRPLPALLGLESRQDYLIRRLGAHAQTMQQLEEDLPPESRLLFLWEPRAYYASRPAQGDATLDNLAQLRLAYGSAEAALTALGAQGFSHVLLFRSGLEFIRGPTPRPPTLSNLSGQPPSGQSLYPFDDRDQRFLDDLLARCPSTLQVGDVYQICRIPR